MRLRSIFILLIFTLFTCPLFSAIPEVKILVAQYENQIDFHMPHGGSWHLDKIGSGEIKPGVIYTLKGKLLTPAKRVFHIMVATLDLKDNQGLVDTTEKYKKMGFKTHLLAVGVAPTKVGMPDNRVVHLGIETYSQNDKAEERKKELALKGIKCWIHVENIQPSTGVFSLENSNGKVVEGNGGQNGLVLKSKDGILLANVEHSKGFSWHGKENRTYLGKMNIKYGFDDRIDCIETTDLESMLAIIVPSEISSRAAKGAIEAQVVAARGEILSKMGLRHVNAGFDYCAEQHCQAYKGYWSKITPKIKEKIKDTKGKVLMMANKPMILDAVYSSNCGGHTSANHTIWMGAPNPHLQGVSDCTAGKKYDLTKENSVKDFIMNPPKAWCGEKGHEGAEKYRWVKTIGKVDWKRIEANANLGYITNIETLNRDVSGRVYRLKVVGTKGTKVIMNELEIRQFFGGLKSSCFVGNYKKDKNGHIVSADLRGAGFGHGVGMCQTGAQSMAAKGYSYELILQHYFPGAPLVTLY